LAFSLNQLGTSGTERGTATGGRIKPDISGYDNVSTVSYGFSPFSGTSAATPHVAGAAALVLSAYPGYTPDQLQSFLEGHAIDISSPGMDTRSGYGRLYLGHPPGGDNTPPTLSDLPDQTLPMNGSLDPAIDLWAYAADAEDSDPDLSFTISNTPAMGVGVTLAANRYIAINPTAGWSGTTQVQVQVQDSGGLTATDTFSVNVAGDDNGNPPNFIYLPIILRN
jgi:subtilisin family serine protease